MKMIILWMTLFSFPTCMFTVLLFHNCRELALLRPLADIELRFIISGFESLK